MNQTVITVKITDAKTKKAKQRLKDLKNNFLEWDGLSWIVLGKTSNVLFSDAPGPWLYVKPLIQELYNIDTHSRWIHSLNDKDFLVDNTFKEITL